MAARGAGRGGGGKKRVAEGGVMEGVEISLALRATRRGERWGDGGAVGYPERREVGGDGSYVADEWDEKGRRVVSVNARGAWERGRGWASMVGWYRTRV